MKFDTIVLGTYRINNSPNLFTQYDDVTTAPRQHVITELVDHRIPFRPMKIAVKRLQQGQKIVDWDYQRYRSEDWALPPRECYQLGFRLADRLRHPRVYAIDDKNEGEAFNGTLQPRINTQPVRDVLYGLNESRAGQVS